MKPNKNICAVCRYKKALKEGWEILKYGSQFACWLQVEEYIEKPDTNPETLFDIPDELPDNCRYMLEQKVLPYEQEHRI